MIDIDESWTWVAFPVCTGCPTEYYFKKDDSSTFTDLHSVIDYELDDGYEFEGILGIDSLCLYEICAATKV